MDLIEEVKAEEAANPWTLAQLHAENDELVRYGAAQARKMGITSSDVNRLIHEYRQRRKAESRSR
jgi:hypothetical protein